MDYGTVLVVDADDEWRSLVVALLARAGLAATGAASGAEALDLARGERPSVVVLDVRLPDLDGLELCRQLRDTFGDALPIVVVSTDRNEPHDRIAALLIGADDYLGKSSDPGELVARVRRHVLRTSGGGRNVAAADRATGDREFGLTPRELTVLGLLASGLTQDRIARQLTISPKTVSSHIQRILAKLGAHSRAQAVSLAHRHGLVGDPAERAVAPAR